MSQIGQFLMGNPGDAGVDFIQGNTGGPISPNALQVINLVTADTNVLFAGNNATHTITLDFAATNNLLLGSDGAITSGTFNVGLGSGALASVTSGASNMAIGYNSLGSLISGDGNTAIGASSGSNYTGAESFNILLGNLGTLGESGVTRIGTNGNQTEVFIAGIDGVNVGSVATVVTESGNKLGTAVLTGAAGITITPGANTITISASGSGFTWHDVIGGSATLAAENGYIADAGGLTTFTMPTNNAFGDTIKVVGKGAGGWTIVYSANQYIIFGATSSTVTAGSVSSTNANDCVEMVCTTASGTQPIFTIVSSVGNISVV